MALFRANSTFNDVLNDSMVQCAICFEEMLDEIKLCPNGHSICAQCYAGLHRRRCPFCNRESSFQARNFAMEKLIAKAKISEHRNWLNDSVILCSSCSELMVKRIKFCETGHSLCEDCSIKHNHCKICCSVISKNGRNFLLERFIEKLAIPESSNAQVIENSRTSLKIAHPIIICPLMNCSYKGSKFSKHLVEAHAGSIVSLKLNIYHRVTIKNFTQLNKFYEIKMAGSSFSHLFFATFKVSNSFLLINIVKISKNQEFVLNINRKASYDIGNYKFKYVNNSNNKKIILNTESLKLSKKGEYVVHISISKKTLNSNS